jgi:hypothetical protein
MPIELWIALCLVLILVSVGWGADKRWRKEHGVKQWHERQGIQPMSEEEIRVGKILADRRAARRK